MSESRSTHDTKAHTTVTGGTHTAHAEAPASPQSSSLPLVAIGALGGTIAMTSGKRGGPITPALDAAAISSAAGLETIASIHVETIRNVPSPSLGISDVLAALTFAHTAVDNGAAGIIITQGTDTMEETSYLLDLLWDRDEPLVVTGAMRSATQRGSEGAMNLADAAVVAGDPRSRGLGVLVVMANEVHAARFVTKSHSTNIGAFDSPGWGPLGRVDEEHVHFAWRPTERYRALPVPRADDEVRVPIIEASFADDGELLRAALTANPRAVVVAGAGAGHVAARAVPACSEIIERGVPLILGTRTKAGRSLRGTYGYPGSEVDLLARGAISAGGLGVRKARILAYVLACAGIKGEEFRAEFERRGA
ncbi:asparaginase [Arcanobacterium haemolyticum]|nr:asparaginase [Arcanobacterium haemolyticum]